jgi:hypothetical protein
MQATLEEKISEFWHDSGPVPGVSSRELDEAEDRLGFKLPAELRTLLQLRNGGIARYDLVGEILLAPLRGIGPTAKTGDLVELYLRGGVDNLPKNAVVFAADSDAWFALDYGKSRDNPSVLHWSEYQSEPVQLAPTFRDFLDELQIG